MAFSDEGSVSALGKANVGLERLSFGGSPEGQGGLSTLSEMMRQGISGRVMQLRFCLGG